MRRWRGDRLATRKHRYAAFGLGLAVGGFIGNFADVLVDGVIVDYIGMGPFIGNIADQGLAGGLACYLFCMFRHNTFVGGRRFRFRRRRAGATQEVNAL